MESISERFLASENHPLFLAIERLWRVVQAAFLTLSIKRESDARFSSCTSSFHDAQICQILCTGTLWRG